jgi:hypothetical protein
MCSCCKLQIRGLLGLLSHPRSVEFNRGIERSQDCYYYKLTHSEDDIVLYLSTNGLGYDNCKIHHNEFHAPHRPNTKPDGFGDDFIQSQNTSGVSVYKNRFISYPVTNYLAGQHQDGTQSLGGDHIKWYNNYLQDVSNYAF